MKVVKNGDTVQKRTHKFKCWNCKCKYIASNGEWYYVSYCQKTTKPTDHVESECPECGRLNKIQWRHKKRDWLSEFSQPICCISALLSLCGMFISGGFGFPTGIIVSFILFIISSVGIVW